MSLSTVIPRSTKYCSAVENIVKTLGHATNQQIHAELCRLYPKVSMTTVHRITTRLFLRGIISQAPTTSDGSLRYDANIVEHDHFVCAQCGGIRDVSIAEDVTRVLNKALDGCKVTGRVVVFGTCHSCGSVEKKKGKK